MSLFQHAVITKYIKALDKNEVENAYQKYSAYFHDPEIQKNIRASKEEQFQAKFLDELFVNIFGYVLNPSKGYNLTTELKNETNSRKVDGAILENGKALAVIELKGTNTTHLDKITDQAFGYKSNQSHCVYVITSNFEKLRFFIDNSVEHVEFNLFTLTRNEFDVLYFCLHSKTLLLGLPERAKKESVVIEDNVSKQLYKDYSAFKNELWTDLVANHPEKDELLLYKKTQKLIDRFLFIFFAEDSGILPPNSIAQMVARWSELKKLDAYKSLYEIFKQYFGYINNGNDELDIFAYGGDLFAPDELLDNVKLNDEVIHPHIMKLTAYDFQTEIDVNILGHIFENSLNEIENVRARLAGIEVDKNKTKRKKDGVFYTPKYITKYIVENTVGKLCHEKKLECGIDEQEYAKSPKGRKKQTLKTLHDSLLKYRDWLLKITICDPACGSGAFLNQSLAFLIHEHNYIDELEAKLFGSGFVFKDVSPHILENNLFGVDINEESVEIAKLSLWLRTAEKGRELSVLNNNLKCGNSLIDDIDVAGDLAFNWEEEFPTVFENGGFDVVIGNPPYGASFLESEVNYLNSVYENQSYQLDSYLLFTEKSKKLVKNHGFVGYIMPNTWLSTLLTDKIRKFVFNSFSVLEVSHYSYYVFEDATVETDTYIFRSNKDETNIVKINIIDKTNTITKSINQSEWVNKNGLPINIYETNEVQEFKNKIQNNLKLGEILEIVQGVKPFQKGKGKPPQDVDTMKLKPFVQSVQVDESFLPLLRGSLMNRYQILWDQNYWISYGVWLAEPRFSAKFDSIEKIVIRQTGDSLIACYDNNQFICRDNLYIIRNFDDGDVNLKYILAILNSKLLTWYFRNILNPEQGKAMAQVKRGHIQELPISFNLKKFETLSFLVNKIETKLNEFNRLVALFLHYLESQFSMLITSTRKLKNWHNLGFTSFIKELNILIKKSDGIILTKSKEMEWMEVFEDKQAQTQAIKLEVDEIDSKIDRMVYEIYDLTEDEIKVVESHM